MPGPGSLPKPGGVLTPPYPPGGPAHSAPPRMIYPFFSPSAEFFEFFIDFYTLQKSSKNRILQNIAKNLKSRTPERPNVDFGVTFGVNFCIDFHEILEFLIINENHRNAYI